MAEAFPENSQATADFDYMVNNPHVVFGTDMVKFLCEVYNIGWHPPGTPNYRISEMSPFNPRIARAARILVRNRDEDYIQKYNEVVAADNADEDEFTCFTNYVRLKISQLFRGAKTIGEKFSDLLQIARLSLVFYQQGAHSAPAYAATFIADGVARLNFHQIASIYTLFNSFAGGVPDDQA